MTAAKRVQRYRLKHGLIKPPSKAQARISELTQKLKEASAQIAQLKGALAVAIVGRIENKDFDLELFHPHSPLLVFASLIKHFTRPSCDVRLERSNNVMDGLRRQKSIE